MPFAENDGAKIYWDAQGSGAPILLLAGLGRASTAWHRTRPVLNERYRTIAMDNRGAGQSDVPPGPYSIEQMATDAVAVLKAASVNTAHVFGLSMGGMIAQEFALKYPSKVRSLILGCTKPGGPGSVPAEKAAQQVLAKRSSNPDEFGAALRPYIYHPDTAAERIEEDMVRRRKCYSSEEAYASQLQAISAWEADSCLSEIAAPTLVIHGENDRLIPVENAKLIAARIRGAKLVIIPKASHVFTTDQPEAAHVAILDFLGAQATRQHERPIPVKG
jgi:pimeloyl-ACP methyl ester carboxylesterase